MTVRVRYAPSPTGDPHVGNIRTALWTWLHARRHGGVFILRLEDTDQARLVPESIHHIYDSLRWLGIDWDEGPDRGGDYGPYVQSERLPRYHAAVARLLADGTAYRCFATAEELTEMREQQRAQGLPPRYDGRYRDYPVAEAERRAAAGEPHVIRFKMPQEGTTTFTDLLRGPITTGNEREDDFVILKSDGYPTYHFASVVDDHAMAITHVTRGDEWIPSTPKHVRLYEALGYEPPVWVHTPVILGPDGGKLSKRHGAKSVLEYARDGYLPEALFNFLTITGWALDDHTEILSRAQLQEAFDLADLSVAPAVFDTQKLEWMNGVYIRQTPVEQLVPRFAEWLERELPPEAPRPIDRALLAAITPHIQERIGVLTDLTAFVDFLFVPGDPPVDAEALIGKRYRKRPEAAAPALAAAIAALDTVTPWSTAAIEAALRAAAEQAGESAGDLFMLCRVAVTGKTVTPPLFETIEVVGRETALRRLDRARAALGAAHPA